MTFAEAREIVGRVDWSAERPAEILPPVAASDMLEAIVGKLGAAVSQMLPSDDQIICNHVRAAHELAKVLWRASR